MSECKWHVPIMPQMKLVCSLSATVSSHISTKTRSLCGMFLALITYDNRVSFRVFASRLPWWLMCNFQFHDLKSENDTETMVDKLRYQEKGLFHLIMPKDLLLRHSQCLPLLCMITNQKKRHRKILFWWRYGCSLWQTVSTPVSFMAWLAHMICILTSQMPSYMPNGDMPKKAPQK